MNDLIQATAGIGTLLVRALLLGALIGGASALEPLVVDPTGNTAINGNLTVSGSAQFQAPLTIVPLAAAGAPTTGTWNKGALAADVNTDLWQCTVAGSPGTWRQLAAASAAHGVQAFSATGTFTVPAGVTSVIVELWGGGGGGGRGQNNGKGGGGGGGGYGRAVVMVTPNASIAVTVGSGGLGWQNNGPPTSGTASQFGPTCLANGGSAGASASTSANGSGGAGGTGSGVVLAVTGSPGMVTSGGTGALGGGPGGEVPINAVPPSFVGGPGVFPGGGGAGGWNTGTTSSSFGGNGAPGLVIVSW
jgi:hypothetical protein